MRDLLEEQLEAYQAIGAYAVIGCEADGGDKESFQRLQSAYSQVVTARKASNGSFGDNVGEGDAKAGRARRSSKGSKGGKGADKKAAAGGDAAEGQSAAADASPSPPA